MKPAFSDFYSRQYYRIKSPGLVEHLAFAIDETRFKNMGFPRDEE
jgi:hypothetical protein